MRRLAGLISAAALGACAEALAPSPRFAALVAPDSVLVLEADSVRIPIAVVDSSNASLPHGGLAWLALDTTVATVDQTGLVRYRGIGSTEVLVLFEGLSRRVGVRAAARFALVASGTEFRSFMRWCGLTTHGALYCLGGGNSTTIPQDTLTRLAVPASPIVQLSVGYEHACAVTANHEGWCWGVNYAGVLGNDTALGTYPVVMTPVRVQGSLAFADIAAGAEHSCGVTTSGDAWCWGHRGYGKLGDGDPTYAVTTIPVKVAGGLQFTQIATASRSTCGLTTASEAWCWGDNSVGQLGTGSVTPAIQRTPVHAAPGQLFRSIVAGDRHFCALATGNVAWCWGANGLGQLGRPADASCSYTSPACAVPAAVTGPAFTQIDAGGLIGNYQAATTCGLTTSGTAMCWGGNRENAIGDGTTTNRSQPTLVVNSPPLRIISVGDFSACGIAISDGRSWCWGYHFGATATPLPYQP